MHRSTDLNTHPSVDVTVTALRVPAALIMIVACTVFVSSAMNGFVLDDQSIIVDNPMLRSLSDIPALFRSDYWEPTSRQGLYRPVTTTSYVIDYAIGAGSPLGYHVTNILLHGATSVLVLLVLARLTRHFGLAWTAALLFAVHPIHSEVVAGIAAGRPDLLATMFLLLALWCHIYLRGTAGRKSIVFHVAAAGAYLLAVLSKESAIVFPLAALLADIVYRPGEGETAPSASRSAHRRRSLSPYAAYLGVACLYGLLRTWALHSGPALPDPSPLDNPLVSLPAVLRTASALLIGIRYLGLLVWPARLSYDYSYAQLSPIDSVTDPRLLLALATLLLLVAGLWLSWRVSRLLFFAIAFYVVTFAIVSNVAVPIGTIMAERLTYLPSVGFILAVTILLRWPFRNRSRPAQLRWLMLVTLPIVVALSWRSADRSGDWASEESLFLHDVAVSPGSAKVRTNAGVAYSRLGWHEEALEQFAVAAEMGLTPLMYPTPYLGAVRSLYNLRRYSAAVGLYRELVQAGVRDPEIEAGLDRLRRDWRGPPP